MSTKAKSFFGSLAAVVIVGSGAAAVAAGTARATPDSQAEQRSESAYTDGHRTEARITQGEAERSALAARPGVVIESHLETEGHGLRWEVKTEDGARVWEIQLDPATGVVLSNQPDE